MYPKNDVQFENVHIAEVKRCESGGWDIKRSDGWNFFVPADSIIEPEAGMPARFYGEGIGRPVRGLFIAGVKVFYRTAEEQEEKHLNDTYGESVEDWLSRWDSGRTVWSVEMGGLGPGYEQAIQITIAELLRNMLAEKYDATAWTDEEKWKVDREKIRTASFANPVIDKLGLSGAQYGAATSVATKLYMDGPITCLTNPQIKDRLILVSKSFPGA